jgi:hypothetical protein
VSGPRRSNSPLDIVRGIKTLKTIYWTTARLLKLVPRVFSNKREEHFGRALAALKKWPELNPEQVIEQASRISPQYRPLSRTWAWPSHDHGVEKRMREYAERAPEDGVDVAVLRETLAGMNEEARLRFMELLVEALPEPTGYATGVSTKMLRKVRKVHRKFAKMIGRDPDGDIAMARRAEIPNPNLPSHTGRLDDCGRLMKVRGVYRGE